MFKSIKGWAIEISQVEFDRFRITVTQSKGQKITFIHDADGCQFIDDIIDLEKYYNVYTNVTYLIDGIRHDLDCDSRIYNFIDWYKRITLIGYFFLF